MEGRNILALMITLDVCANDRQRVNLLQTRATSDEKAMLLYGHSESVANLVLDNCEFLLHENPVNWPVVRTLMFISKANFVPNESEQYVNSRYWKILSRFIPHVMHYATFIREAWIELMILNDTCLVPLWTNKRARTIVTQTDHWSLEQVAFQIEIGKTTCYQ